MREPSKRMRNIADEDSGELSTVYAIIGYIIIVVLICVIGAGILNLIYQIYLEPKIGVFLAILGTLIYFSIQKNDGQRTIKYHQMAKERKDESICTFARSFPRRSIDTWVIRAVYEEIQDYPFHEEKIPLRQTDDVFKDLEIDDEDFSFDIIENIAKRCRRTWDDYENNPFYEETNTVGGLVRFFNAQPIKTA